MSKAVEADGRPVSDSSVLADLIDRLTAKLQAGEPIDWDDVARQHPEHVSELQRLRPALGALGELSRSGPGELSGVAPPAGRPDGLASGVLGDFRIIREVGRGGMGVVYEAEQVSLGRRVALKVLPFAGTMDPRHLQRFQNEARAAACLHHGNIVPVYSVGCERGVSYYAMQFIDGCTLADVIREMRRIAGPVAAPASPGADLNVPTTAHVPADGVAAQTAETQPAARQSTLTSLGPAPGRDYYRRVAELGVQAAEALDHAHQLGIVHRDVKPGNLLLDGRGNLWVADFGLAHVQHGDASLTMTGDLVGTLRYMSPEQALAKRVPIDHRTDVYSLGATLYELLTLRTAFEGKDRQEVLRQIAFEEPARPRRVNREIPHELEVIALKAMEKNAADRYGTAKEMADDLRRFLDDRPILAKRPTLTQRVRKWVWRNGAVVRAALAAGFLTLVVSVASALVLWGQMQETKRAKDVSDRALVEKAHALNDKTQALDEKTEALYRVRIPLADRELAAGNTDEAERLLDACPAEERQWEWHYLKRQCHNKELLDPAIPFASGPMDRTEPVFTAGGQRFVYALTDGRIIVRDTADWHTILESRIPDVKVAFDLSPDGRRLAGCDKDGNVKVWDVTSGKQLLTLDSSERNWAVTAVRWRPDGRCLATCFSGGEVHIWDAATGRAMRTLREIDCPPAFSLDGQRLAGVLRDGSVTVWAVDSGEQILTFKTPASEAVAVTSLAFGNQWLAIGKNERHSGGHGFTELWDTTTKQLRSVLPGSDPLFSPDGQRLACRFGKEGVNIWAVNFGEILSIAAASKPIAFSPDGGKLACHEGDRIHVWEAINPPGAVVLDGSTPQFAAAFSPDGRRTVVCAWDGTVTIADTDTGRKVTTWLCREPNHMGFMPDCLAFSPDGRSLAIPFGDSVKVQDVTTGQLLATLRGHTARVTSVAYSPDGRRLATGSWDKTVKLWDVATGQELLTLRGHAGRVWSVAFSADGRRLLSGSKLQVDTLVEFHAPGVQGGTTRSVAISEDVKVWDVQTGLEMLKFSQPASTTGDRFRVAFSPDGRHIYSRGEHDGTAWCWDATTGQELHDFGDWPPGAGVLALAPDGQRIATGSGKRVEIRDVRTGQEILTLRGGPKGAVTDLAFSRDGARLVASDWAGSVTVWDATPLPEPAGHDPNDDENR